MSELENIKRILNDYETSFTETDLELAIKYNRFYYQQELQHFLEMESLPKNEIKKIINTVLTQACKTLVEERAGKRVDENIVIINSLLKNLSISSKDIFNNADNSVQAFYETENLIESLTYTDYPMEVFKKFLVQWHIVMELGNDHNRFCFCFEIQYTPLIKELYYCNTIYDFLKQCADEMLIIFQDDFLDSMKDSSNILYDLKIENFDLNTAISLRGNALYDYLSNFEYAKINYDLEELYLLLHYAQMPEFQDDEEMEKLKRELITDKGLLRNR